MQFAQGWQPVVPRTKSGQCCPQPRDLTFQRTLGCLCCRSRSVRRNQLPCAWQSLRTPVLASATTALRLPGTVVSSLHRDVQRGLVPARLQTERLGVSLFRGLLTRPLTAIPRSTPGGRWADQDSRHARMPWPRASTLRERARVGSVEGNCRASWPQALLDPGFDRDPPTSPGCRKMLTGCSQLLQLSGCLFLHVLAARSILLLFARHPPQYRGARAAPHLLALSFGPPAKRPCPRYGPMAVCAEYTTTEPWRLR